MIEFGEKPEEAAKEVYEEAGIQVNKLVKLTLVIQIRARQLLIFIIMLD